MAKEKYQRKMQEVEELSKLIEQHTVVGVASAHKVRAPQLQALKKKLRSDLTIRVTKNSQIQRALEKCEKSKPNLKELSKHITGASIFMFTNMNPFKLSILLDKSKVKTVAKAGDIAPTDIMIPAGNTGLPPGPVIAELTEVGLPTKIETGSVVITKDAVVAKKGGAIHPKLASVLSKLGVKPIEVGLVINTAYDDGVIITSAELRIDLEAVEKQLQDAQWYAKNLAINSAYPTAETIGLLLMKARTESYALAIKAAYPAKDVISDLISKAYHEMMTLTTLIEEKVEKAEAKEKKETGEK